jgi:hypothetical protein
MRQLSVIIEPAGCKKRVARTLFDQGAPECAG